MAGDRQLIWMKRCAIRRQQALTRRLSRARAHGGAKRRGADENSARNRKHECFPVTTTSVALPGKRPCGRTRTGPATIRMTAFRYGFEHPNDRVWGAKLSRGASRLPRGDDDNALPGLKRTSRHWLARKVVRPRKGSRFARDSSLIHHFPDRLATGYRVSQNRMSLSDIDEKPRLIVKSATQSPSRSPARKWVPRLE